MPYNFIFNVFHTEGNIFPTLRTAFYVLYARPFTYIRSALHVLYARRDAYIRVARSLPLKASKEIEKKIDVWIDED